MADFLDKLSDAVARHRDDLARHLQSEVAPGEEALAALAREHWSPLRRGVTPAHWRAYAVDGSISEIDLDNGATIVIVQSLCMGDDAYDQSGVEVDVLPAAMRRSTAARIADLMLQQRELYQACETAERIAPGSVLFIDGALYGRLPQLYDLPPEDLERYHALPDTVLANYLRLLQVARDRPVRLVAVSKTSREPTHCKIWLRRRALTLDVPRDLTDSELIHRFTDRRAGVSVPVVLGTWGFTGGSRELLERSDVAGSPAIVSFFVRLADYDDALRIDVPAGQAGCPLALGDLDGDVLDGGAEAVRPVTDVVAADYGGLEVYNALLYSVDREVRLKRSVVGAVYLPLIESQLGVPVRPDRSERRFG